MSSQTAPKQPKQPGTLKNRKIFVSQIDTTNLTEPNGIRAFPSSQPSTCNNAMPPGTISPLNKMQPNVRSVRQLGQQLRTDVSHSPTRTKSTRALSSQQASESVKDTSLKINFSKVEQRPKNGAPTSPSSREKSKRRKRATTAKDLEMESLLQEPRTDTLEALVSPLSNHAKKKSQGHKNDKMMKLLQSCVPSARVKKIGHQTQSMAFTSTGLDITGDIHHMSISHLRKPSTLQDGSWESLSKPVTPQVVLDQYSSYLSAYEKEEIKEYSEIYFLGDIQNKVVSQTAEHTFDDERGDYTIIPGDHIRYQYEVIEILGRGAFGHVAKVFDHKSKEYLALKIIRNHKKFQAQAKIEIKLLEYVTANKGSNYNIVEIKQHFMFRQHQCMLFDLMSMNLYNFLQKNKFQGLNINLLKNISTQLLFALKFLNQHKLIHCDIKPENILFRYPNKTGIRLIDFGSSCFEDEKLYTYIQSRFYRSPEIILGLNYNTQIDMWSFGCLLCELYTGSPIFAGDSENDQLAAMMEVLGAPDAQLLAKASRRKLYFDDNCFPKLIPNTKGRTRIPGSIPLSSIITGDKKFLDFIQHCLNYDPKKRFTPDDALAHPWIQDDFPHDVKSQHIKLIEKVGDKSPIGDAIGSKFALDLRPLNDKDSNSVIIQDSKQTTRGLEESSLILLNTETLQREVSYGSVDFSTVKQLNNENKPKSKSTKKGTKHISNQSSLVINTSINLGRSAQNSLRSKATKSKDNLLSMLSTQSPKENLRIASKCESLSLKNRDQNKLIEKLSKATPANKSSERQLSIGINLKENKTVKDKVAKENKGKEEENLVGKLSLVDPKNKASRRNLNAQKSMDIDPSKMLTDMNGTLKSPKNIICLSLKSPKVRKMV